MTIFMLIARRAIWSLAKQILFEDSSKRVTDFDQAACTKDKRLCCQVIFR